MVALLLIACFLLSAILGVVLAVSIQAFRAYAAMREAFLDFVSPAGPDKPSPMAETIDLMAQSVSARLAQQLLASFNGQASGMARGLKAVEADIAQSQMAMTGNPLTQIAAALFQKQIKKNPMLGVALSQLNLGGNNSVVTAGNNGHDTSRPKFSL